MRSRPVSRGRSVEAMTLLELIIAAALCTLIFASAYTLMNRGQQIEARITRESEAIQTVRLLVKTMTDEIQEGTRLVYPLPGQESSTGLVIVNARGEMIFYYVSSPDSGARSLWRECANDGEKSKEVVVRNVVHFRATTAPASPGRTPSLVKIDLDAGTSLPGVEANIVTAALLGSLEKYIPEDSSKGPWPYPPATPE